MTIHDVPLESFAWVLEMEERAGDSFATYLRGFGGRSRGRAAAAMARTCADRELSAFQATFLRAAPEEKEGELSVTRLRDGRLLAHRRVELSSEGRLLLEASATFVTPGDGIAFQRSERDRDVPEPESLPDDRSVAVREGLDFWPGPVEFRWIGSPLPEPGAGEGSRWSVWLKPRLPMEDDPVQRAGALAFLCDIHCDYAVRRRLGASFTRDRFISLEQSLWVHEARPWDDWWLMTSDVERSHAGRALNTRRLFDREGRHLASMAQHSLLRDEPAR